jgi:hypothetical protein
MNRLSFKWEDLSVMSPSEVISFLTDSPSALNTVLLVYLLLTRPSLMAKEQSRSVTGNGSGSGVGTAPGSTDSDKP